MHSVVRVDDEVEAAAARVAMDQSGKYMETMQITSF